MSAWYLVPIFFISLTAWTTCSQKTISPSEVPGPAFSVQFCSVSDISKIKFELGTKQAFPGRNEHVCGHGAGSCVPTITPGKRLCLAGGLI